MLDFECWIINFLNDLLKEDLPQLSEITKKNLIIRWDTLQSKIELIYKHYFKIKVLNNCKLIGRDTH